MRSMARKSILLLGILLCTQTLIFGSITMAKADTSTETITAPPNAIYIQPQFLSLTPISINDLSNGQNYTITDHELNLANVNSGYQGYLYFEDKDFYVDPTKQASLNSVLPDSVQTINEPNGSIAYLYHYIYPFTIDTQVYTADNANNVIPNHNAEDFATGAADQVCTMRLYQGDEQNGGHVGYHLRGLQTDGAFTDYWGSDLDMVNVSAVTSSRAWEPDQFQTVVNYAQGVPNGFKPLMEMME